MVNEEKMQAFLQGTRTSKQAAVDTIRMLTEEERFNLFEALVEIGQTRKLSDINLESELLGQYEKVCKLQKDVIDDEDTPVNQRAQVANAVASTLQQLLKMQTEFYTSERFKALEALMIKALKKMPAEAAEAFVAEYEEMGK